MNNKHKVLKGRQFGEVIKDGKRIYATPDVYCDVNDLPTSLQSGEFGIGPGKVVVHENIVPNTRCKAILRTSIVDKAAMEAKTVELEALLEKYGAQLNGSKHKYDAHLLHISPALFTTTTEEECIIILHTQVIEFKTEERYMK